MINSRALIALMAAAFTGGRSTRPRFTRAELKTLRRSGNRTAPPWLQVKLLARAADKRDRRRGRNMYNALA